MSDILSSKTGNAASQVAQEDPDQHQQDLLGIGSWVDETHPNITSSTRDEDLLGEIENMKRLREKSLGFGAQ
ncbi:hypothetical protein QQS21_003372 [Conoideocrella luteorostrata]|uniref:Uncharacterized protein n=1 Tax=Conoideocrella luteorostrata TaxID=1105319 RepID=A0AAJ0G2A7_9HYPO|nr:hypothetical protein QQS21_003372 [Conoideocrella luteorostrata]